MSLEHEYSLHQNTIPELRDFSSELVKTFCDEKITHCHLPVSNFSKNQKVKIILASLGEQELKCFITMEQHACRQLSESTLALLVLESQIILMKSF